MKTFKKTLSFFLALLMIFTVTQCVMPVFAEEISLSEAEDFSDPEDEAEYIEEDISQRTSNSKTFLMSDGSFQVGLFSVNINNQSAGPRRAHDRDTSDSQINGTYIKNTDTAESDHSEENIIKLGQNSIGVVECANVGVLNNYHVKTANLYLPVFSGNVGQIIYAYYLDDEYVNEDNLTFSAIQNHITMIDYAKVTSYGSDGNYVKFDVTAAMRTQNQMVILTSQSNIQLGKEIEVPSGETNLFKESGAPNIVFSYNYIVTAGLDDNFEYESYDLGTAGDVYINMQSGNLVIKRDDISTGTGENAFDISSTFNSMSTGTWFQNHEAILFLYGSIYIDENGTFSLLWYDDEENVTENGVTTTIRYLRENDYGFSTLQIVESTSHDFVLFPGTRLEHTISISSATKYLLTSDEGKTRYIYTSEYGLTSIEVLDENNEWQMVIGKFSDSDDATGNTSIIKDADGNVVRVTKTDASVTMTQVYSDGSTGDVETFIKDENGNVESIVKNNRTVATYTYDDYNRMLSATDDTGHKLTFGYGTPIYDNCGDEIVNYKISSVRESFGTTAGKYAEFTYNYDVSAKQTAGANGIYGDSDDLIETYSFDNNCHLICTSSKTVDGDDLNSVAYSYVNDTLASVSSAGKINVNYLKNHNIEKLNGWTEGKTSSSSVTGTTELSDEFGYVGLKSLKVSTTSFAGTNGFGRYQEFSVGENEMIKPGETYVASAYINIPGNLVKTANSDSAKNYGANVMVQETISGTNSTTNVYSQTLHTTNGEWERVFSTFTVPENCTKIRIHLQIRNATGTAYFDAASLEIGKVPEDYNMLENNGFNYLENTSTNTGNLWIRKNMSDTDNATGSVFAITGDPDTSKYFYQDVYLNEYEINSKFILNCVAHANSAASTVSSFAIRARAFYADNTYSNTKLTTKFNKYKQGSQYIQMGFELPKSATGQDIVKVRIYFLYQYNIGNASVEKMSLVKTE